MVEMQVKQIPNKYPTECTLNKIQVSRTQITNYGINIYVPFQSSECAQLAVNQSIGPFDKAGTTVKAIRLRSQ